MLDLFVEIRTVSEANNSSHWAAKYKRQNNQKTEVYWNLLCYLDKTELKKVKDSANNKPINVLLIRRGKRLMDSDNLTSSLKSIRDAIADFIYPGLNPGLADSYDKFTFHYGQLNTKKKVGVWVIIYN